MKVFKFLSQATALILSASLSVSSLPLTSNAFCEDVSDRTYYIESFEIDCSVEELLGKGVDCILYYDETTDSISTYTGDISIATDEMLLDVVAVFHYGLTFHMIGNDYNFHWQITCPQVTYVSVDLVCEETSLLFPDVFYSGNSYQYFDGSSSLGFGGSPYFDIPVGIERVKIDANNVIVRSVTDSFSVNPGSDIVTLSDIKP